MRIVLGGGGVAKYLQGGGHWSWVLQYLRGLSALGHEVLFMQFLATSGSRDADAARARTVLDQLEACWPGGTTALLVLPPSGDQNPDTAEVIGVDAARFREFMRTADVLWSLAGGVQKTLRDRFRRRVLVDVDPGHLQLGPNEEELRDHDAFLTVGLNAAARECEMPKLGKYWHIFAPFVYLPDWKADHEDRREAPFSSVTHWNWGGEVSLGSRTLSVSKRDAYLRYVDLPRLASRPFELATKLFADDGSGDWQRLHDHGWSIVDPWQVASTPARYRDYIASSRAELCCPKPLARELRTGWFSDRSVAYLASGKPVLAEVTGFEKVLPCGSGLVAFADAAEALAGVAAIDGDYRRHSLAARELAREHFDSARILPRMIEASS